MSPQLLLLLAVAGVGVLHTLVPDHWLPIALMARQEGWRRRDTAWAAAWAGVGHSLSTLTIGVLVWLVGAASAARFGQAVSGVASAALIGFGLWVALASFRELRRESGGHNHHHGHAGHGHAHDHGVPHPESSRGHRHEHRHQDGRQHMHYHRHPPSSWHEGALVMAAPLHEHEHQPARRRTLLLILGSSPMIEGIPAFFAASRFGLAQLAVMGVIFTLATTVTYVALCMSSAAGLQRADLGPLERYGEVLSGAFIALVGFVFLWIGL